MKNRRKKTGPIMIEFSGSEIRNSSIEELKKKLKDEIKKGLEKRKDES